MEKDDDSEASVSELDAKTKADNDKQAIDKKPPVGLKVREKRKCFILKNKKKKQKHKYFILFILYI